MATLTVSMVISSFLGWFTVGVSMAAFVPLIMTNAVQRRSGTGPGFLAAWLVADAINLAGLAMLGAQPTQIALAAWYCMADGALTLELAFFGHSDWGTKDPQRARNLIRKIQRRETPWWWKLTSHFRSFTIWDDIVLLCLLILLCTTCWGVYMVRGLWLDPDTFEVEIPTEWDTISFAMGITASLIFSLARIPEFISGERRSKRNDEPVHELDDPLWWYLILENFCNLASIFTLSQKIDYLKVESPWIIGSVLSILFDGVLLWRVTVWRKRFYKAGNPAWERIKAARDARDLKRKQLKDELEEREEEWDLQDIMDDATREKQKIPENAGRWAKRHVKKQNDGINKVAREYKKVESHPVIQDLNARSRERAARDAAIDKLDHHVGDQRGAPSFFSEKRGHAAAPVHSQRSRQDSGDGYGSFGSEPDEAAHLA